jgi:hypothetical protein
MDGVVLTPSALAITVGLPPSITATQLLVVPKSIPIILPIAFSSYIKSIFYMCLLPDQTEPLSGYCVMGTFAKQSASFAAP